MVILGDRVLTNDTYYVPPDEYLSPRSAQVEYERARTGLLRRNEFEEALRDAEARFRTAVDLFPSTYAIYDTDLRYTFVNKRATELMGARLEDLIGRTDGEAFGDTMSASYKAALADALATGATTKVEYEFELDDGTHQFESYLVPVPDEDGDVAMVLSVGYDQTERNRLLADARRSNEELEAVVESRTRELREANAALGSAAEAKNRFMANMSHDLRTPLNSIIGFSGVLLGGLAGPVTDEQTRQLEMIRRAGMHLLEMVNDTLDLARIEAGRLELDVRPFDLGRLVGDLAAQVGPLAEAKGLGFAWTAPTEPVTVSSDEGRVCQVVLNLLSNAVKYTVEGKVSFETTVDEAGDLHFIVADTGVGIAEDDLQRVFEEYEQLPSERTGKSQGAGLGLAICRRLARMLGGRVTVSSSPGEGSTFVFTLPASAVSRG